MLDLRDPAVIAEAERRFAKALAERTRPDPRAAARVAELGHEIENLVGAIAGGLLKASPALAKRLAAAEEELARLQAAQQVRAPVIARIAPRSGERFERMAGDLELHMQRDPDRSRAALIEAIGPQIVLRPDESRKFLRAEYGNPCVWSCKSSAAVRRMELRKKRRNGIKLKKSSLW